MLGPEQCDATQGTLLPQAPCLLLQCSFKSGTDHGLLPSLACICRLRHLSHLDCCSCKHGKMTALLTRRFVTCALLSAGLSTSSSTLRCQELLMACHTIASGLMATSGPSMMGITPSTISTPGCIGHSCLSTSSDVQNSKAFQVTNFHQLNLITKHVLWTLNCVVIKLCLCPMI